MGKKYYGIKHVNKSEKVNVVVPWSFTVASEVKNFTGLQDYTAREDAVDQENDFDVHSELHTDIDSGTDTSSKAAEKNFGGFVDYTTRTSATRLEDDVLKGNKELTATFDGSTYNLTKADTKVLRQKLKNAYEDNGVVWKGAISFRTEFLVDQHLYNLENGHLDQRQLKRAVQAAMPEVFRMEHLDESAFWWGDIQFDTQHLHIHVQFSEEHSSRPLRFDGNRKGMLSLKSMETFKSRVYHHILSPEARESELDLYDHMAILRKKLTQSITINPGDQQKLLNQLYKNLPRDKKLWSYHKLFSSNAAALKPAKKVLNELIDNYLNTEPAFSSYQRDLRQLRAKSEVAYGKTSRDPVEARIQELRTRIANQILKNCRDIPRAKTQVSLSDIVSGTTPEENRIAIDRLRQQIKQLQLSESSKDADIKQLKRDLGLRRLALKKQNAAIKLISLTSRKSELNEIKPKTNDEQRLLEFHKLSVNEQINLMHLRQKSLSQLTVNELKEIADNELRLIDVVNIQIDKVDQNTLKIAQKQLNQELNLVQSVHNDQFLNQIYNPSNSSIRQVSKQRIVDHLHRKMRILTIKAEIKTNRDQNKEADLRQLYQELKLLQQAEKSKPLATANKQLTRELNAYKRQMKSNGTQRRSAVRREPIRQATNQIANSLTQKNRDQVRATMAFINEIDAEEIEIEKQEEGKAR